MTENVRSRNRRVEQREVRRMKTRWPLVVKYGEHGLSAIERMTDREYREALAAEDRATELVKRADPISRHPEGFDR